MASGPQVTIYRVSGKNRVVVLVNGAAWLEVQRLELNVDVRVDSKYDARTDSFMLDVVTSSDAIVTFAGDLEKLQKAFKNSEIRVTQSNQAVRPLNTPIEFKTIERPDKELRRPLDPAESKEASVKDLSKITEQEVTAAPEPEQSDLAETALAVTDVVTDFVPFVSNIKDATIALSGINPVTGEKVGVLGRVIAGVFAIPGIGNVLKYVGKGGKLLAQAGRYLPKAIKQIGRALQWIGRKVTRGVTEAAQWAAGKATSFWHWLTAPVSRIRPSAATPPSSTLSQPGGLSATEGTIITRDGRRVRDVQGTSSKASHVLRDHGPDVTDDHLINQLADKGMATKFSDRATMENVIAETIEKNRADIDKWIQTASKSDRQPFNLSPGLGSLGTGFQKNSSGAVERILGDLDKVRIVLKADGQGGYVIQSAFPWK